MRKNYPQVTDEQFEFGILNAEDKEEQQHDWTVDLILQLDLSPLWPTCRSSPYTLHTSWHTWHIHLSTFDSRNVNLPNLQHFCVWKKSFFRSMEPRKIWSKIPGNTLSDALRHVNFCFCDVILASGGLAGRPGPWMFPVPVPCSQKTPLREQVVPSVVYTYFRQVGQVRTDRRNFRWNTSKVNKSWPALVSRHAPWTKFLLLVPKFYFCRNPKNLREYHRNGGITLVFI